MSEPRLVWAREPNRKRVTRVACFVSLVATFAWTGVEAQTSQPLLVSRAELTEAAVQAELGATKGDYAERARSAMLAAAIRQRLATGISRLVTGSSSRSRRTWVHRDTAVVRTGRLLELSE